MSHILILKLELDLLLIPVVVKKTIARSRLRIKTTLFLIGEIIVGIALVIFELIFARHTNDYFT